MTQDILDKVEHLSAQKRLIGLAFLMGAVPLVSALVAQYIFHLNPCHLCILQRIPYAAMAVVMLGVWLRAAKLSARAVAISLWLCVLALVVDSGMAVYHVAVEQHWITGPGGCTAQSAANMTLEELKAQIMGTPVAMCDNPSFYFMGLTMAAWNVVYAFGAAVVLVSMVRRQKKDGV